MAVLYFICCCIALNSPNTIITYLHFGNLKKVLLDPISVFNLCIHLS